MDDRNDGVDGAIDHIGGWNLWYRTSLDGGATWTAPGKRVSRYDQSQSQSQPQGFLFPYGDYTGMTMNPNCTATQPAWRGAKGTTTREGRPRRATSNTRPSAERAPRHARAASSRIEVHGRRPPFDARMPSPLSKSETVHPTPSDVNAAVHVP
jgi:hypothetical protein